MQQNSFFISRKPFIKPAMVWIVGLTIGLISLISGAQAFECAQRTETTLSPYFGKWTVNWRYRTAPGEYSDTEAESVISAALDGCALREVFEAERADGPYFYEWTMTRLDGDMLSGVWFDSAHGDFLKYMQGDSSKDWPVQLVWSHENGRMKTRFRVSPATAGGFVIERHLSTDRGVSWSLTSQARYRAKRG